MPIRLFRRRPVAEPPLAEVAAGLMAARDADRIALMVLALGPRLNERLDLDECLRLAAAGNFTDGTRETRFVETLARLARRIELNAAPARHWTGDDRRRLFDPDFLARRCAGEPVLAELNDLLWHAAVARLREAGENPAAVALEAMGLTAQLAPSRATAR
ncbi:hypothetical protein JL101_022165 [Skermanella rosea]|uniref:hypothetical protein n=1 Tax=Skermanella rosea TaxID=1817965 RepID=UPI0019348340|nr:hypothetical protein [Skermanella rosea]UEM02657.1 hypothetical protein JL101_022165 [Skermanella rosea]